MTKDEIISIAKKFGLATWHNDMKRWTLEIGLEQFTSEIEAFAAAKARQPLTEEQMYSLYCEAMKGYYVSALHYWRDTEAHKFARAIEAAVANQPPRQPLTDEQIKSAVRHLYGSDAIAAMAVTGDIETARVIEAAHGIGSTHG